MCVKSREAQAPLKTEHFHGVTYVADADHRVVAAMAAPREDARGPLTTDEQKRWIADNTALLLTALQMVDYIRERLFEAVAGGATQLHVEAELRLLANARNTSVAFEWEQIRLAIEAEGREEYRLAA